MRKALTALLAVSAVATSGCAMLAGKRATPDLSAVADVNTGVLVYYTPPTAKNGGWWIVVRVFPPGMKRARSSCSRRDSGCAST